MSLTKFKEALLKGFKRSNKSRREQLAKKYGFDSVEAYKNWLEATPDEILMQMGFEVPKERKPTKTEEKPTTKKIKNSQCTYCGYFR